MERQSYSNEFKDVMRAKLLNRGNRSKTEICKEAGVSLGIAGKWLVPYGTSSQMKKQKNSQKWSPEQKLKTLIETGSLSEAELGAYLRKEGLFNQQLEEWKKEFLSSIKSNKSMMYKDDRDQKIKSLERELLRKDKALAEASALLILQKKVNLIWGNKDEDEK
jgi:transposase-like protein